MTTDLVGSNEPVLTKESLRNVDKELFHQSGMILALTKFWNNFFLNCATRRDRIERFVFSRIAHFELCSRNERELHRMVTRVKFAKFHFNFSLGWRVFRFYSAWPQAMILRKFSAVSNFLLPGNVSSKFHSNDSIPPIFSSSGKKLFYQKHFPSVCSTTRSALPNVVTNS